VHVGGHKVNIDRTSLRRKRRNQAIHGNLPPPSLALTPFTRRVMNLVRLTVLCVLLWGLAAALASERGAIDVHLVTSDVHSNSGCQGFTDNHFLLPTSGQPLKAPDLASKSANGGYVCGVIDFGPQTCMIVTLDMFLGNFSTEFSSYMSITWTSACSASCNITGDQTCCQARCEYNGFFVAHTAYICDAASVPVPLSQILYNNKTSHFIKL